MSILAVTLAGEIRAARAALHRATPAEQRTPQAEAAQKALNHAAACLADLERAERLLDSERSSAEAARAAMDRALQIFEIEQQQQRLQDETQDDRDERAALAIAGIDSGAEDKRLRETLALAGVALREAAKHRGPDHAPGETAGETQDRWNEAARIEEAAIACRKAARSALAALVVFPDKRTPDQIREKIEATRAAALNLKHAIDLAQRDHAQRQIRIAARDLKRQISDCAAIEAGKAAERKAQQEGGAL